MDRLRFRVETLKVLGCVPDYSCCLPIVDAVENTIATQQDEVVIGLDPESLDLGCCDQNLWIPTEFDQLCLNVAESSTDRKTSRENSKRPLDHMLALDVVAFC